MPSINNLEPLNIKDILSTNKNIVNNDTSAYVMNKNTLYDKLNDNNLPFLCANNITSKITNYSRLMPVLSQENETSNYLNQKYSHSCHNTPIPSNSDNYILKDLIQFNNLTNQLSEANNQLLDASEKEINWHNNQFSGLNLFASSTPINLLNRTSKSSVLINPNTPTTYRSQINTESPLTNNINYPLIKNRNTQNITTANVNTNKLPTPVVSRRLSNKPISMQRVCSRAVEHPTPHKAIGLDHDFKMSSNSCDKNRYINFDSQLCDLYDCGVQFIDESSIVNEKEKVTYLNGKEKYDNSICCSKAAGDIYSEGFITSCFCAHHAFLHNSAEAGHPVIQPHSVNIQKTPILNNHLLKTSKNEFTKFNHIPHVSTSNNMEKTSSFRINHSNNENNYINKKISIPTNKHYSTNIVSENNVDTTNYNTYQQIPKNTITNFQNTASTDHDNTNLAKAIEDLNSDIREIRNALDSKKKEIERWNIKELKNEEQSWEGLFCEEDGGPKEILSPKPIRHNKDVKGLKKNLSSVRYFPANAFKFFMEQHVESVLRAAEERTKRRIQLEDEMQMLGLGEMDKIQMRNLLIKKESQHLRLRRSKMNKEMFDPIAVLGSGAFGDVHLVRKKDTGVLYAMKSMRKRDILTKRQMAHVKAERDILAEADNSWVVKLYFSFQDAGRLYLVMDYIPGGDLMGLLMKKGIFCEILSHFYISELVLAIESVHKLGFVHRDIKPDNVLIDAQGHIKLTDFGLCTGFRWTHDSKRYHGELNQSEDVNTSGLKPLANQILPKLPPLQLNKSNSFAQNKRCIARSLVGTPNYIAPEILCQTGYTKCCDWWSVGVILYEMRVGQPPFRSDTALETQLKVVNWRQSLRIPKSANLNAQTTSLILRLCCDPDIRLGRKGASEVKNHAYFKGVDFEKLRQLPAPYVPRIEFATDVSNFDQAVLIHKKNNTDGNKSDGFSQGRRQRSMSLDSSLHLKKVGEQFRHEARNKDCEKLGHGFNGSSSEGEDHFGENSGNCAFVDFTFRRFFDDESF